MTWWDSIVAVNRFNIGMQWLSVVFVILAGLSSAFSIVAGRCLSTLQAITTQQEKEKSARETAELQGQLIEASAAAKQANEKLAPRRLSPEQISGLEAVLRQAVSEGKADRYLVVAARMMDAESLAYAKQIYGAVEASGWPNGFTELSTHSFQGLTIFHNPEPDTSTSLGLIREAFNSQAITFSTEFKQVERIPIQHAPCIYIVVGHK